MRAEQVPQRLRALAERASDDVVRGELLEAADVLDGGAPIEDRRPWAAAAAEREQELRERVRSIRYALELSGRPRGVSSAPDAVRLDGALTVLHTAVAELLSLVVVTAGTSRPAGGLWASTDGDRG